jgi:ATP-dependent helicase/nuclease subunit A
MPSTRLPHLLIRASAGTGKTFQLSNRFLELLRRQVGCDHILATTFTRKAAGEILDRVILRLAEAAADTKETATSCGSLPVASGSAATTAWSCWNR